MLEIRDYYTSKVLSTIPDQVRSINAWCDMTGYKIHHYSRKGKSRIAIVIK